MSANLTRKDRSIHEITIKAFNGSEITLGDVRSFLESAKDIPNSGRVVGGPNSDSYHVMRNLTVVYEGPLLKEES